MNCFFGGLEEAFAFRKQDAGDFASGCCELHGFGCLVDLKSDFGCDFLSFLLNSLHSKELILESLERYLFHPQRCLGSGLQYKVQKVRVSCTLIHVLVEEKNTHLYQQVHSLLDFLFLEHNLAPFEFNFLNLSICKYGQLL